MKKACEKKLKEMKEDGVEAEIKLIGWSHEDKMEFITMLLEDPEIKFEVVFPDHHRKASRGGDT